MHRSSASQPDRRSGSASSAAPTGSCSRTSSSRPSSRLGRVARAWTSPILIRNAAALAALAGANVMDPIAYMTARVATQRPVELGLVDDRVALVGEMSAPLGRRIGAREPVFGRPLVWTRDHDLAARA